MSTTKKRRRTRAETRVDIDSAEMSIGTKEDEEIPVPSKIPSPDIRDDIEDDLAIALPNYQRSRSSRGKQHTSSLPSPPTTPTKQRKPSTSPYFSTLCRHEKGHANDPWGPCLPGEFGLIQERVYKDPWRLLVATTFLNKTRGTTARPLLWTFFQKWPTPQAVLDASLDDIVSHIQPLGLHNQRAKRIKVMAEDYLAFPLDEIRDIRPALRSYPPTRISHIRGVGIYALDSFRIFCDNDWESVTPTDKELIRYIDWRRGQQREKAETP